ncbi:MAG: glycosyltransferase family 4 protein [Bacillota bacterium]
MAALRVLYVDHVADIGGAQRSLLEMLAALDRKLVQPTVVCRGPGRFSADLGALGVEVLFYGTDLVGKVAAYAPHLIHSNAFRAIPLSLNLARMRNTVCIGHCRDMVPVWERQAMQSSAAVDYMIAVSSAVKRRLATVIPYQRIVVIHNGVDTGKFAPMVKGAHLRQAWNVRGSEVLFGVVGQVIRWKGHVDFLHAAKMVTDEGLPCKFVIVGDSLFNSGEFKEELKALVITLGLSDRVVFAGFRHDMPAVMAALDVLVLPSWEEPFGRVLVEAMSSGRAVIATNAGGVPEVVIRNVTGLLVPPRDPRALYEAMAMLARSEDLRRRFGTFGRKRAVERFSIRQHVERILCVYETAMEARR